MTRIAWVSSVYGGYDVPAAPAPQDAEAEYVLVTDRPCECPPWRVVVEPRPQLHPRLACKIAKSRPDLFADADVYIWTDANVRVADPGFIAWCLDGLGDADMAVSRHPDCATISADMELSLTQPRYSSLPMRQQVASYAAEGFPESYGSWWTGMMIRRRRAVTPEFGDAWLREQARWTNQDQISLPYVLWKAGIVPADLPPGWLQGRFGFSQHGPEPVTARAPAPVRGWRGAA
jgi:Protein of unknown function (DUF616)